MNPHNSGSGAHLTCDIANAIDALENAAQGALAQMIAEQGGVRPGTKLYAQGYTDACRAVRIAFGIPPRSTGGTVASVPETKRIGDGRP